MSATTHLQEALRSLTEERDQLNSSIRDVEELIRKLGGSTPEPVRTHVRTVGPEGPSVRDVTMQLASEQRVFSASELMKRLESVGNDAKPGSVTSLLSRMKRNGLIESASGKGNYQLAKTEESPVVAEDSSSDFREGVTDTNEDKTESQTENQAFNYFDSGGSTSVVGN